MNPALARLRSLDAQRPWVLDCVLAVAIFVAAAATAVAPAAQFRPADATLYVLLALGAAPYAVRRRWPLPVLMLASIPVLAMLALGYSSAVIGAALFLAAYTVAAYSDQRVTALAAAYILFLLVALVEVAPGAMGIGAVVTNAALFTGAFALGRSAHVRRENVLLLQERAQLAEQAHADEARHAVADERLRIAQELHDVLGHSLGVIALQAGVGAHVIDVDPAEAKASLEAISRTSRSSLAEVRRILGALRTDTDTGPRGYHPPPGLDALDALAAELTEAGLPVRVHVHGVPHEVPAALDLTGYRVAQEALTNVVRHAGPAQAEVTVRYEDRQVTVQVDDDGRGTTARASSTGGHGQLGMRERVAVWGGTLHTGPRPEGGYRVIATLPYETQEGP
ncbi:MAG TPA: sensor histidine kinase [Motilibacterales bacterium]|nr:sensor histidine kinase [Motilibacterales bacterium]